MDNSQTSITIHTLEVRRIFYGIDTWERPLIGVKIETDFIKTVADSSSSQKVDFSNDEIVFEATRSCL